jgi:hypothetical protein
MRTASHCTRTASDGGGGGDGGSGGSGGSVGGRRGGCCVGFDSGVVGVGSGSVGSGCVGGVGNVVGDDM